MQILFKLLQLLFAIVFLDLVHHGDTCKQPTIKPPSNKFLDILTKNPISLVVKNSYSFFYNFPKRNVLYDRPVRFFKNSTSDFLAWYQFPHNLPPYRYVGQEVLPTDFFCWGLPGNTLPFGNWVRSTIFLSYNYKIQS